MGTVLQPEVALSWSRLEADGVTRASWSVREPFILALDDGTSLVVEPSYDHLELGPASERSGRFRDFAGRPEGKLFGSDAPAPHRKARLRWVEVKAGDRVTVSGQVVERAFGDGGGHRSAPGSTPSRVEAIRVVLGDPREEPASGLREASRARIPISAILMLVGACLSALLSVRAFLAADGGLMSPAAPDGAIFALGFVALALTLFWYGAHPPGFHVRAAPVDPRPKGGPLWLSGLTYTLVGAPLVLVDGRTVDGRFVNNHGMILGFGAVAVAGCLGWVLITGWNTARLGRLILRARPLAPGERGEWGRLVGTVDDPTPVLGGDAAMAVTRELEWDDSGEHELQTEAHEVAGFLLRTESEAIAVDAGSSTWATDVRRFVRRTGLWRSVPVGGRLLLSTEVVPQGAAAVVAGRVRGDEAPRLRSSGPESLLLFATAPGGDPLAALRRVRFRWLLLVGALVAAAVAVAVLHVATLDRLPEGVFWLPDD